MLLFGRGNGKRKFVFLALFNDERRIQSGALPNFCDDLKNYNDTFLLSYFSVTKSTKSHQRERSPLFANSSRVHELVARSSAWRVRAAKDRAKVGGFIALHSFIYTTRANISHEKAEQIRARIACTPAYIGVAGVGLICALTKARIFASLLQWEKVARFTATDEVLPKCIAEANPISLCSHPYFCHYFNREVRHSLTWHSSESESARGRFEPVAVVKL